MLDFKEYFSLDIIQFDKKQFSFNLRFLSLISQHNEGTKSI